MSETFCLPDTDESKIFRFYPGTTISPEDEMYLTPKGEHSASPVWSLPSSMSGMLLSVSGMLLDSATAPNAVKVRTLLDDITMPAELQEQKSQCKQAVQELLQTAGEANWDGEGADPVTEEIVETAMQVVDHLPLDTIEPPEISADPHGNVEFDWYLDNGTMFTISIGIEGDIALSGLHAKRGDKLSAIEKDGDDPLPRILSYGVDWLRKMKDR